jgi:hypothetical protein
MELNNELNLEISTNDSLSFTEKFVGLFFNPTKTFSKLAAFPPKTIDWLIPLTISIIITLLSIFIHINNPAIQLDMKHKEELRIQKMVDEGKLSHDQAIQLLKALNKNSHSTTFYLLPYIKLTQEDYKNSNSTNFDLLLYISLITSLFLNFFLVSAVLMIFVKKLLGGQGSFKSAMVAFGLPIYILIAQSLTLLIITLLTGKMIKSTSIASFINIDKQPLVNFVLAKLDIFYIWYLVIASIGFAKMFRSVKTKEFILLIFDIWLGFGILIFMISRFVPFPTNF